jgi:hypothetical protein
MSNHVILVKSYQSFVIWAFSGQTFSKVGIEGGGEARGGQICLPKPSATASLSGRRQKGNFTGKKKKKKKKIWKKIGIS